MAKGGSEFATEETEGRRSSVNTGVLWPEPEWAESQVLRVQTKLHLVESRMRGDTHVRFGGRAEET